MSTKLYVGNLSYDAQEQDLKDLFTQFGAVTEVFLPIDKFNNRPRGFAFVTFEDAAAAAQAIEKVNGQAFMGRNVTVNEARPKEERPAGERRSFGGGNDRGGSRGGFGGGRGGFGGGRGGFGGRRDDRGGDRY